MRGTTSPIHPQAAYTSEPIYRLTVDQWHDLIDRGKLTADDPVELIEGMLVFKMPKNPPHALTTGLLEDMVRPLLPAGWHFRTQEPVTLDDGEPEPDGAVVRGSRRDFSDRHPMPVDLALVIEVADSTLSRDRGIKLRSYARAGIICYWIVNLIDRQIEVHADPDSLAEVPRFRSVRIVRSDEAVGLTLDGRSVGPLNVGDILPPG